MDSAPSESELLAVRREKLAAARKRGNAYPNDFHRDSCADELHNVYGAKSEQVLDADPVRVRVSGRLMAKRVMGKASFVKLQDMSGQIQLFVERDALPEGGYAEFKTFDVGDICGAAGRLFKTKTGELTVRVEELRLLSKSLRPLPEKFHGLSDQETRYRRRYVDLIVNPDARRVFELRTRIVAHIRQFMDVNGFMEVETPMMQPLPGGAVARPFATYHNALDMALYLRIAPELYLKRLVVGGFERVYEINRNFRNEGISTRHNPEFTMLEFYQAYATYRELMNLTEAMLRMLAQMLTGSTVVTYQGTDCDLGPDFLRLPLEDAIVERNDLDRGRIRDVEYLRKVCERLKIAIQPSWGAGKLQLELFEQTVEPHLQQPVFVTDYPTEVSPLSRQRDDDPFLTERFELFIAGRELANGFSELNDPDEQAARFRQQASEKAAGDEEAMYYDEDYVRALEYGLPPTAGEGIGIDRLVMFFADAASIRDVILFPLMRPEA